MELDIAGDIPDDAKKRLITLLSTPKFSVPFDRGFGIDMSFIDYPTDIARIKMLQSCIEQVRRYEYSYEIVDVELSVNDGGEIKAKVVIKDAS